MKIVTFFQGMIMGIAEIIPGVSGSTLALVMGIYDDFINLLHDLSNLAKSLVLFIVGKITKQELVSSFKKVDFKFGATLLTGMVIAVLLFSHFIETALNDYPNYIFGFFFGLILSSVIIPFREIQKLTFKVTLTFVISTILTFILLGFSTGDNNNPSILFLFFGGVVGVSGLLLPGVSGSFILLMLGIYEYVISAVKAATKLELKTETLAKLIVFGLGLITGFIFFVRILKFAFSKYHDYVLAFITGVMIGSLRVIYPFFELTDSDEKKYLLPWETIQDVNKIILFISIIVGIIIILVLQRFSVPKKDETQKIHS